MDKKELDMLRALPLDIKIAKSKLRIEEFVSDIVETGREVYGRKELTTTGEKRTGCVFCGFDVHLEKGENRYQRLQRTHPQLHTYCMETLGFKGVCELMGIEHSLKE